MKSFRDLKVWEKAHGLTLQIYGVTRTFPKEELYGLTSQIRRSSSSIGANIAEGCGRKGNTEFCRFLQLAMGSASELEYHLLLARDLQLLETENYRQFDSTVVEIKRMLAALIRTINDERDEQRRAEC